MAETQTKEQVELKLRGIVEDQMGCESEDYTLESKLVDDLGADSLDVVEMTMEVEEEFAILIDDKEMEDNFTISQWLALVLSKLGIQG